MQDYNIPAAAKGYLYSFKYKTMDFPLYLCAEHSESFKLSLRGEVEVSFIGNKGFNYWLIEPSNLLEVVCDKKIFNLYLSYTPIQPKQFY